MSLRDLPSVESLITREDAQSALGSYGRRLTLEAIRHSLEMARAGIRSGAQAPSPEELISAASATLDAWTAASLRPVINATGVILHTNLGRAPLSRAASQSMLSIAGQYSTLEYDLEQGGRGARHQHAEGMITRLSGAQAALVVNNNAAAVLLALTALAKEKAVVISRSQLIEIGGGFRIPEILAQSGARLVEVGTTNRTRLQDFEEVIGPDTGLILRAHHSNFRLIGFTAEPSLAELVGLSQKHRLPLLDDLGSGALMDTAEFGLGHEPTVQESVQAGAPLVAFSGDKLLGGPQAGILVGEEDLIGRLRQHPLARAVRPDKLCLAALSATLNHYLKDEATSEIPIWRMMAAPAAELQRRATAWSERIRQGRVVQGKSTVGGGSLPEESLPTWLLALSVPRPHRLVAKLRKADPPVIARLEADRLVLDPRTVLPEQDAALLKALEAALGGSDQASAQGHPGESR